MWVASAGGHILRYVSTSEGDSTFFGQGLAGTISVRYDYTKLFGTPVWNEGGYSGWQIGTGFVTVGPHDQVKGTNAEIEPPGLDLGGLRAEASAQAPAVASGLVHQARAAALDALGDAEGATAIVARRLREPEVVAG